MKYIKKLNINFDNWENLKNDKWIKPTQKLSINTQVKINFDNKHNKLIGNIIGYYRHYYIISFKKIPGEYIYGNNDILIKK